MRVSQAAQAAFGSSGLTFHGSSASSTATVRTGVSAALRIDEQPGEKDGDDGWIAQRCTFHGDENGCAHRRSCMNVDCCFVTCPSPCTANVTAVQEGYRYAKYETDANTPCSQSNRCLRSCFASAAAG